MFCFIKKIIFPDPLRDSVDGNVLIIGSKGSGAITVAELVKSANHRYSNLGKLSISPNYNSSVDAMKRSFGIPVGASVQVRPELISEIKGSQVRPTIRGVTLSLTEKVDRFFYDRLVSKALDAVVESDFDEVVLISIADVDLLKASTVTRIRDCASSGKAIFILTATSLRVRSDELMDVLDCLIVTRVYGVKLLYSKFHSRFSIDAADPRKLSESGRGEYCLFLSSGRFFSEKIRVRS